MRCFDSAKEPVFLLIKNKSPDAMMNRIGFWRIQTWEKNPVPEKTGVVCKLTGRKDCQLCGFV